jgi:hypothetical protein
MISTTSLKHRSHTDSEAVDAVRIALKNLVLSGKRVLLVIHGYGASGVGGSNREAVRAFLASEVGAGRVKRTIPGERLSRGDINDWKRRFNGHAAAFEALNSHVGNEGVTLIEF